MSYTTRRKINSIGVENTGNSQRRVVHLVAVAKGWAVKHKVFNFGSLVVAGHCFVVSVDIELVGAAHRLARLVVAISIKAYPSRAVVVERIGSNEFAGDSNTHLECAVSHRIAHYGKAVAAVLKSKLLAIFAVTQRHHALLGIIERGSKVAAEVTRQRTVGIKHSAFECQLLTSLECGHIVITHLITVDSLHLKHIFGITQAHCRVAKQRIA